MGCGGVLLTSLVLANALDATRRITTIMNGRDAKETVAKCSFFSGSVRALHFEIRDVGRPAEL